MTTTPAQRRARREREAALRERRFQERRAALDAIPLIPEDPARLTGPEIGARVRYVGRSGSFMPDDRVVTVVERSYVWSPERVYQYPQGEHRGIRRYDWSVVEYAPGRRVVVNDTDLEPLP